MIENPELILSSLEGSNSEIIKELGEMITVERAFEFQQKALETVLFLNLNKMPRFWYKTFDYLTLLLQKNPYPR